jgi:small-conductance mechanosensitive channel
LRRDFTLGVLFAGLAVVAYGLSSGAILAGRALSVPGGNGISYLSLLAVICAILAAHQLVIAWIRFTITRRGRAPGEVQMLAGLVRLVAAVAIAVAVLASFGRLTAVGAVIAGFAGLLLGWSLQAPVSGMAAWALVSVKRPFRVGDRILLPSLALNGDVMDVGPMYTRLNQVGGSVGSEEAIGRHILIPNAMLFSQVVINYTPGMGAEQSAYFLDEVVVRVTFDSDWTVAEGILLDAAREVTASIISATGREPYIRSDLYDYGVYMRLRYMTQATDRPRITHEITKRVIGRFQRDLRVDLAIPYVYSYRRTVPPRRSLYPPEAAATEEIAVADIDDTWQPGSLTAPEEEAIQELAGHIEAAGLLQPLVVERKPGDRYGVLVGMNRLRACKLLGWERVPAVVRHPHTPPTPGPAHEV